MYRLIRSTVAHDDSMPGRHVWPVTITAEDSVSGDPAKIFIMQVDQPGDVVGDQFSCVTSVPQLTELPEDAPDPGVPFYRVASITVRCRSASHAEELWVKIKHAVQMLADNLQSLEELSDVEEVVISPSSGLLII